MEAGEGVRCGSRGGGEVREQGREVRCGIILLMTFML